MSAYGLEVQKQGNRTRLRLVDLIAHRDEPENGAPGDSVTHTQNSQKLTPQPTLEVERLRLENQFLRHRIEALAADQAERKEREKRWNAERDRLQGIIERQTNALPKPSEKGLFSRFLLGQRLLADR